MTSIEACSEYKPEIEHGAEIWNDFQQLEASLLSQDTKVSRFRCSDGDKSIHHEELDEAQLSDHVRHADQLRRQDIDIFFTYKFLVKTRSAHVPADPNKLRLSTKSFWSLVSYCHIPAAFVYALSRWYLPVGRGSRTVHGGGSDQSVYDYWYLLPVRVQVDCTDKEHGHALSRAGGNQMDPDYYLHLSDAGLDLRGSTIAVFSRHNIRDDTSTTFVVNLMDGRWARAAEEPQRRIKEVLTHYASTPERRPNCFVHLVYLTSVVRWWTNSLNSVKRQLIAYEKQLEEQMDSDEATSQAFYDSMNRALHSIAAHVQRYQSDLKSVETTTAEVQMHDKAIGQLRGEIKDGEGQNSEEALDQVMSQIMAISDFAQELEKKIQNILALLFNRMQIMGDRLQIANGRAMQEILRATEAEARMSRAMALESRKLSKEMKKDSVAMKTIAVVTMFFLPGATFAALLSMPFFQSNQWLSEANKAWVWVALTVPSTVVAFAFYWKIRQRDDQQSQADAKEVDDIEMDVLARR